MISKLRGLENWGIEKAVQTPLNGFSFLVSERNNNNFTCRLSLQRAS